MGMGLCIQRRFGVLGDRSVAMWPYSITTHEKVAASSDHTARLWEMSSGETVRQYNGHHKGQVSPFQYFYLSHYPF